MQDLKGALTRATTAEEAAAAASDAIDALVPGRAAISADAGRAVNEAADAFDGAHSFQNFVLAVLVSVGRVLGAWERVPRATAPVSNLVQIERDTRDVIAAFIRAQEQRDSSHDPEVRSMFYRLIGIVADPTTAVAGLRSHVDSEADRLARACLFEGLLVAMLRSGVAWPEEVALIRAAMQSDPMVGSRLAHVPFDYVGENETANRDAVEHVLGVQIPDRDYGNCWPSELL